MSNCQKCRISRVDLLAELVNTKLLQIELQSSNITDLPLRMLEYGAGIWRVQGSFPRQIVLYVGNDRLRMPGGVNSGTGLDYQYHLVDIRDLDGEALLASDSTADNILAVLTELNDKAAAIRRIIGKIARLRPGRREDALRKLLILCGMRGLARLCQQESKSMPVDMDIMDHEVLGPLLRKEQYEGRLEATKTMLRRQIEKRFGSIPTWADQRLKDSPLSVAEDLVLKVIDARSIEELLG